MIRLIAALAILFIVIICIYAIERVGFRQSNARAAGIPLALLFSDLIAVAGLLISLVLLIVVVPLGCLYFLQVLLFGQQRAKVMQPAVWLRRICSWPLGASSRVRAP